MTRAGTIRIAAAHVTIVGDEIYMPYRWSDINGPSTSTPVLSRALCGLTPQQQRAGAIAYGAAVLLGLATEGLGFELEARCADRGGQAGAAQMLRRAVWRTDQAVGGEVQS